jgi:hypothetical protein
MLQAVQRDLLPAYSGNKSEPAGSALWYGERTGTGVVSDMFGTGTPEGGGGQFLKEEV